MPRRAFDSNGGIPPWVTVNPNPISVTLGKPVPAFEAPSDDPYCAEHGKRFDPERGCPDCLAGTDYRSPANVTCPTCGAKPEQPCERLNGGGMMTQGWHYAREHVV